MVIKIGYKIIKITKYIKIIKNLRKIKFLTNTKNQSFKKYQKR